MIRRMVFAERSMDRKHSISVNSGFWHDSLSQITASKEFTVPHAGHLVVGPSMGLI